MKDSQTSDGIHEQHMQAVSDGVLRHGQNLLREQGGVANPIACTVLEDGILIGGVTGRTEFRRLFINYLWVDEAWRGRKLGTDLLHRLEALALAGGCRDALIETLDDGAATWYKRGGYRIVAHRPGYCGPWSRHTLLKILNPESDV